MFTLAGNGGLDSSGGIGNVGPNAGTANNAVLWFNNTAPVAFSTAGAKTLTLQGSSTGDNEIDLQLINNTIDGSALGITKAGAGTWILGNTNNTYSGPTIITGGALRAQDAGENATSGVTAATSVASNVLTLASTTGLSIGQSVTGAGIPNGTTITDILSPTQIQISTADTVGSGTNLAFGSINSLSPNSNLVLNGGVLESTGTFTRSLGMGPGQVQWLNGTGNGGFAASSSSLIVAIGGLSNLTPLVFGTSSFTSGTFMLGSVSALADTTVLNPIDLNGASRTITVTDNSTTFTDIYTLAGVISGRNGSSLNLNGGGSEIIIAGANTYSGNTTLSGNIAVSSIGSGGSSSAFGDATGQLNLGTGTTTTAYLLYTGPGETTTRTINLNTTTGQNQIDASGSGALVLNNVVNLNAGAKNFVIRGINTDLNTVNSALADYGGGSATLASGGAVGTNTFVVSSITGAIAVGEMVTGGNIPAGSTVTAISGNTVTINNNFTTTPGAEPVTFGTLSLTVLKADGGTWVLNGANTYTGATLLEGGLLGVNGATTGTAGTSLGVAGPAGLIAAADANTTTVTLSTGTTANLSVGMGISGPGFAYGDTITGIVNGTTFTISAARTVTANSPLIISALEISNGGIFATNPGGLTVNTPVVINDNTVASFVGANSITINSNIYGLTGNVWTISNTLQAPAVLTINGNFVGMDTASGSDPHPRRDRQYCPERWHQQHQRYCGRPDRQRARKRHDRR